MSAYDWDLIERLLHEVQNSAGGSFTPRVYADELATELERNGRPVGNLDSYKQVAADCESLLYKGGFIESRPQEEGGNGENFILTPRGAQLLQLISRSSPGSEAPRALLDEKGLAALVPEVFDQIAGDLARSPSVP